VAVGTTATTILEDDDPNTVIAIFSPHRAFDEVLGLSRMTVRP
jgi:hypothetical protein